jgi:hypothetical protein
MRAFRGGDQLNHFLRAAEPVRNQARVTAQSFHGELSCDARLGISRIFSHETNFVQPDSRTAAEICFEAFGKSGRLDGGFHKRAHKSEKILARHVGTEADAGHVCFREQVSELALGGSRFERHSIEQELRSGCAQQKSSFA